MKKSILMLLIAAVCASAYCETISRRSVVWVQGHQESTYCGSGGCITFTGGYELPYSIGWDFYKGQRCSRY